VFRLSEDLPLLIVIVDSEDRIRAFLPELYELVSGGLAFLDEVQVVRYLARDDDEEQPRRSRWTLRR
jgi:uncharacterized protein